MNKTRMFKCMNCGRSAKIKYDDENSPLSLWCEKCQASKNQIKKKFKMKNSSLNIKNKKDPYIVLAQMKVLLDRTKPYWNKGNDIVTTGRMAFGGGIQLSKPTINLDASTEVLSDLDKLLKKAKIPPKYLIAESLG